MCVGEVGVDASIDRIAYAGMSTAVSAGQVAGIPNPRSSQIEFVHHYSNRPLYDSKPFSSPN